ncbi:MAG: hypothetical protein AB7G93_18435 [Bdellovibrionales bacterium]
MPTLSAHRRSYTYRFAQEFAIEWRKYDSTPLMEIDLAEPFVRSQASFDIRRARAGTAKSGGDGEADAPPSAGLTYEGQPQKIVYAFHPQASVQGPSDYFQRQAMRAAYSSSLVAAGCPNPPLMGHWGLHLSFLHGRRLLMASGLPVARVAAAESLGQRNPGIRPFQTFLLPNLKTARRRLRSQASDAHHMHTEILELPELSGTCDDRIVITHVVCGFVLCTGADDVPIKPAHPLSHYDYLARLTGSQVLELVELDCGRRGRPVLGIHPCLTRPTKAVLDILRFQAGNQT